MKLLTLLFFLSIFLVIPSQSQSRITEQQDSGLIKSRIYKYERMAHSGKILTITGGSTILAGGVIFAIYAASEESIYFDDAGPIISCIVGGVGLGLIIPGIIRWNTGNVRAEEFRIRLNNLRTSFYLTPRYYITPKYSGITLAFRF